MKIACIVPIFNWEKSNLIDSLKNMGHEVFLFDHIEKSYNQYDKNWDDHLGAGKSKYSLNKELRRWCRSLASQEGKIDFVFCYLSDPVVYAHTIDEMKILFNCPIANFGCNNVLGFDRANKEIASHFDVTWYVEDGIGKKFDAIDAKSIQMPYGVNVQEYQIEDSSLSECFDVCFVGQLYGYRLSLMNYLCQQGYSVVIASKIEFQTMLEMWKRSKIVIGTAGIGGSNFEDRIKQLKLRDFEVPASGNFYLTEHIKDLENNFVIGDEIDTFRTLEELVYKCEKYLKDTNLRHKIANAGYERATKDHTWDKRFNKLFSELGL